MIRRKSTQDFIAILKKSQVLMISGPRNAGKSNLSISVAKRLKKKFALLDCSKAMDRKKLENPDLFFATHRAHLIILDEIQFMPQVLPAVHRELIAYKKPCRFILISSFYPDAISEYLLAPNSKPSIKVERNANLKSSGRGNTKIIFRDLEGINLKEAQAVKLTRNRHWFRGGYPQALKSKSDKAFLRWTDHFLHQYTSQELPFYSDLKLSPGKMMNCLKMIASFNGNILNLEQLARSLGVTGPTAKRYLNWLENAYLLRSLPPWLPQDKKRLIRSPKIYLRDSGLLHTLLGIENHTNLCTHIAVGGSWEGYVVNEICKVLPTNISAYYYRTQHGAEADLVLVKNNLPIACIDISYSSEPSLKKGFRQCIADLKTKKNYLLYPGKTNLPAIENIRIISLETLLDKFLPAIR